MDKRTILFVLCIATTFFAMNYYFAPQNKPPVAKTPPSVQVVEKITTETSDSIPSSQNFYVLENEYQQLVFSDIGGSLNEINLPFKSDQNKESVVLPIDFDRTLKSDYPYNDHFPQHAYYTYDSKDTLKESVVGGYYPLVRRDLILNKENKKIAVDPNVYALNIVSDFKEMASLQYKVVYFDKDKITFEAIQPHRKITKTYSFIKDTDNVDKYIPYTLQLDIQVEGDNKGLFLTSGVLDVELVSGSYTPLLKYQITRQNKPDISLIDLPKEREVIEVSSLYPNWISNSNGYFGIILNPITDMGAGYKVEYVKPKNAPTRLAVIDGANNRFPLNDYPGYNVLLPIKSSSQKSTLHIFAGPYSDTTLHQVDSALTQMQDGNPNYTGSQTFQGWFSFISEPFAKFLLILLNFFYKLSSSWAASIILLTIALRIMLYPLNAWSFKSMKRMQQMAPLVSAIQAKYKKEPKKAQIEIMNLYREHKANPFTGCLPLIIQMPFLIGMFDLLKSTFALRGAPFIPGWIDNLTAPDVLFSWNYPVPFFGTDFHLLPIILGLVMFCQQRMSATGPKDPNQMTDQQRQQRAMGNIMVIVFTVMFYHFPSGLNIYWLSSMLLGMLQQWYTNKKLDALKEIKK